MPNDSLDIQAQLEWHKNVNSKMVVMIKNAADVLETYAENLEAILVALKTTQGIYSRLHSNLIEALDEPSSSVSPGLHETELEDVPERR